MKVRIPYGSLRMKYVGALILLFGMISSLYAQEEEKKEACDNFTPQSFKPTQCANCFLLVTDHPNAPEELLAAERERLAKLEEQKAKVKEHQADLDRLAEIEKEHERKLKEEEERIVEAKRLARIEMEEEAAKVAEAKRKQEEEIELKIAAELGMNY